MHRYQTMELFIDQIEQAKRGEILFTKDIFLEFRENIKGHTEVEIQMVLESSQAVRVNDIYVGGNDYPHARVLPKVIMAYWDDQELAEFFDGYTFPPLTPDAPKNLKELKYELEKVRQQGYVIDDQHVYPGVSCIAAPIFKENGKPIAAFGLSIPGQRFQQNKTQLLHELLTITEAASRSFGFVPVP